MSNSGTKANASQSQRAVSELFNLSGKVAIVTGGAGWLGSAMCEALAEQGAHVYIASRNFDKARTRAQQINERCNDKRAHAVEVDISSEPSVASAFKSIIEQSGQLDVLINNAHSGSAAPIEKLTLEQWNQTIDVGLTGYYLCLKAAVPYMVASGGGSIINVSSMYGMVSPHPDAYEGTDYSSSPVYGAVKGGIIQLTRYAACYLAKDNIRVNTLSLGPFPQEPVRSDNKFGQALKELNPMKRLGEPWEVKGAVAYLASAASSYMTGQNLVVDGGWTAW